MKKPLKQLQVSAESVSPGDIQGRRSLFDPDQSETEDGFFNMPFPLFQDLVEGIDRGQVGFNVFPDFRIFEAFRQAVPPAELKRQSLAAAQMALVIGRKTR